jgi:nitrous oxide reductase accessory protein NosL
MISLQKILLTIFLIFSYTYGSEGFLKYAENANIQLLQKGIGKEYCPICGMKLQNYYKTNHTAKLSMNGNVRQYCSMRCLVVDMQEYGIDLESVKVIDGKTEKFISAKNAFYVVGSKVSGTMSMVSKIAFANESDAKEFQAKYGGEIVDFHYALKEAQDSLKNDNSNILKKKKKKVYPRGKKIYEKVCDAKQIDPNNYIEINELKDDIVTNKFCKPLKEKDLQAVALYIWEVKRLGVHKEVEGKLHVHEKEKCPVCGMFTYKYPRWAAQIFYEENGKKVHWSFDGVKDLIKFYFDPMRWGDYKIAKKENISKILVTDYYSQKGIDGTQAYYVIRSNVYGPMGHEFIPFEYEDDAKTFMKDHLGKKIIHFNQITEDNAYELDYNE